MSITTKNVGLAFGAVFGAGAATCLGASVVFFPKIVKFTSKNFLASSLGISAGVMTYVSFVEIFSKSQHSFVNHLVDVIVDDEMKRWGRANLYATLSFFSGVVIMLLIDLIVKVMTGDHHHHRHGEDELFPHDHSDKESPNEDEVVVLPCLCINPDLVGNLEQWHQRATSEEQNIHRFPYDDPTTTHMSKASADPHLSSSSSSSLHEFHEDLPDVFSLADEEKQKKKHLKDERHPCIENVHDIKPTEEAERKKLAHMGLTTAIAISLHNFPEGLATFVAVLQDPEIGAVLAIAIAIHNIPEGFCVALPVYYSTGNRWKAFLWGSLSGMTEPIGAITGWLILSQYFSDAIYGAMYGIVAGMMVMISLKELLPTAHRYDPHDVVVTHSLIGGMTVIALSLVLFYI